MPSQTARRRILFVSEAVTLAQVVRLSVLARGLSSRDFEVHFACRDFPELIFAGTEFRRWPLLTIDKEAGLRRLAKGERIYDAAVLTRYTEAELELFAQVKPELIVGDFRLSLAVSTALTQLPLLTLINAYWSPYAVRESFPVPDHPLVSLVGPERALRYLPQALPKAFAYFAAPLERVRARFGLPPIGGLLEQLTFGDFTLYPDLPELCPVRDAPTSHVYLGGVSWSPDVALPAWWDQLPADKPVAYVTLGSSGSVDVVPAVFRALSALEVCAVFATADRVDSVEAPDNVFVTSFLPGDRAAQRARVVITNGGASTGYQALAEGVPVLGIPYNLDQYLATAAIERAGAGVSVRAGSVTARAVQQACVRLLNEDAFRGAARRLQTSFAEYDCHQRFGEVVRRAFSGGG